jgi:hypothetical protein
MPASQTRQHALAFGFRSSAFQQLASVLRAGSVLVLVRRDCERTYVPLIHHACEGGKLPWGRSFARSLTGIWRVSYQTLVRYTGSSFSPWTLPGVVSSRRMFSWACWWVSVEQRGEPLMV